MHYSRMRTVRSSSHLCRGVSASVYAGIPSLWSSHPPQDQAPPRADPPDQAPPSPPGADPPVQVHPPGSRQPPPTRHPPCGQTDACKNITFATSLRTVIIGCSDSNCSTCYLNIATSAGLSHTPH